MVYKVKGYFLCDMCGCSEHFIAKSDEYYNCQCVECGNRKFMTKYDIAFATARKYAKRGSPSTAITVFNKTEKLFNEIDNKTSYSHLTGYTSDGFGTIVR